VLKFGEVANVHTFFSLALRAFHSEPMILEASVTEIPFMSPELWRSLVKAVNG
jgi:hypothetical protein